MPDGWVDGTLADLVYLDVQRVPVVAGQSYPVVGVLGFGRGLLYREPVTSDSTRYQTLNRVRPGQLIYSKLKAFEGAITVVSDSDQEAFASGEFPTYSCSSAALPGYLRLLTQQPALWERIASLSKGLGGRRERLSPNDLLTIRVRYPNIQAQRRIVDLVGALDDAIVAAEQSVGRLQKLISLFRDSVLWRADSRVPLGDLCRVDGRLVVPDGERALMPHVGTDRIVGGTGDLVGVVSAAEDGVTSGKYSYTTDHVIYSKIRPNLRKVALPTSAGLCSADAYPLLPTDGVPRRFLQQLLLSTPFTEAAVSRSGRTKMPKINRAELMSIEVPFVEPEEMSQIAERLDALVGARQAGESAARRARTLRANLLTALLSGEHAIPKSHDELLEATG